MKNIFMKKRMLKIFLLMAVISILPIEANVQAESMDSSGDMVVQRTYEDTRWYYRTQNGKKQKRLWSLTRGEWVTGWIAA